MAHHYMLNTQRFRQYNTLKCSYFDNELYKTKEKIINSRSRALFRVNGVSIDSSSLTTKGGCLSSSPEAQGLPNALKLRTKVKL